MSYDDPGAPVLTGDDLRRVLDAPPGESYPGAQIVRESPGNLGVILWHCLRDVLMWCESPPSRRATLFREGDPGAGWALRDLPELKEIAHLLEPCAILTQSPGVIQGERLADACEAVAAWAIDHERLRTARAYAATVCRISADRVPGLLHLGRALRGLGRLTEACDVLERARALAKDRGWAGHEARVEMEIARVRLRQSEPDAARRALEDAERNCTDAEDGSLEVEMLLSRCEVHGQLEDLELTMAAAGRLLEHQLGGPALAWAGAQLCLALAAHGGGPECLALAKEAAAHVVGRTRRSYAQAVAARCAAVIGERQEWRRLSDHVRVVMLDEGEYAADAWLHIAFAAALMGATTEAAEALHKVVESSERWTNPRAKERTAEVWPLLRTGATESAPARRPHAECERLCSEIRQRLGGT